jgi:hypothetical protein
MVISDKGEVDFFVLNNILTETIRRKAWIINEATVIRQYIIVY